MLSKRERKAQMGMEMTICRVKYWNGEMGSVL